MLTSSEERLDWPSPQSYSTPLFNQDLMQEVYMMWTVDIRSTHREMHKSMLTRRLCGVVLRWVVLVPFCLLYSYVGLESLGINPNRVQKK